MSARPKFAAPSTALSKPVAAPEPEVPPPSGSILCSCGILLGTGPENPPEFAILHLMASHRFVKMQINCLVCNKALMVFPSRYGRTKFCSRSCHAAHLRSKSLADRFWPKVSVSDGCWEWRGAKDVYGYGSLKLDRVLKAHRVSWMLNRGPIPDGMGVLHKCDNPPCVNPAHLFLGTQADNDADRTAKGRTPSGETHCHAKLSDTQVSAMRDEYRSGVPQKDLAIKYGIGRPQVSAIINNKARVAMAGHWVAE